MQYALDFSKALRRGHRPLLNPTSAINRRPQANKEKFMVAETKKDPKPAERKTITVDLTDHPALYDHIIKAAALDERTPSSWLRRQLREQFEPAAK